jgi:hypothetical protein
MVVASNTAGLKQGEDLDFLKPLAWESSERILPPPVQTRDPKWAVTTAPGEAAALDFSKHDQNWELTKAHDLWVLPVPGYPLAGGGHFDRIDDDNGRFAATSTMKRSLLSTTKSTS